MAAGDAGHDPLEEFLRDYWDDRDFEGAAPAIPESDTDAGSTSLDEGASGQRFGRYRLLRLLGRGGQGTVFLAEDTKLRRRVALKLLTAVAATSESLLGRFRREAELAGKIDHPGICTVHDSGVQDGTPFIAMQFVEGRSLADRIAAAESNAALARSLDGATEAAVDETGGTTRHAVMETVRLFEEVARALHVAHEAGIVHRDIKPANIMLTAEGQPVMLDFGIAADLEGGTGTLTRTGDQFGTPAYMSPEQLALRPSDLDRRSDIFSLVVSLYETLTLRRPFEAPTREGMYLAIRTRDPAPPSRINRAIPRDLEIVIGVALDKDRNRRFETALELAEELRRVRRLEPIHARPAGPLLRLTRWAQRRPALAGTLGALFLVLAVGLIWSTYLLGLANARLGEVNQLAALNRARELVDWSEELYPPGPELLNGARGMDAWLREAEELVAHEADYRRTRTELVEDLAVANPTTPEERVARDLDAVRLSALDELLAAIAALPADIERMRARRDYAANIDSRCFDDHAEAWRRAVETVAADSRFHGLTLARQRGLVPIGRDRKSGLVEFAHLQSGAIPQRDPESGRLRIDGDSAIVLVLLPGGAFTMGQSPAKDAVNHNPNAEPDATHEHRVTLDPFFLSKYEMTQGQWLRVMYTNPSTYRPGVQPNYEKTRRFTLRHPVEQVSYNECVTAVRRLGLVLPTEAQWEYACRAGSHTIYSDGNDLADLKGRANIYDAGCAKAFPANTQEPGFDDGYTYHAPVGTFLPNEFGLHDMHGNLWEACRDWFGAYTLPVRPGDGLRLVPEEEREKIVNRSSSFDFGAFVASCGLRNNCGPDRHHHNLGFRAARALER